MADSAIVKTGKPFFVPHFAHNFTGTPALVMHIDRLGKHIAPRFAHRYCLAVAPAIKVTARGIDAEQHHQATSALAHSFDGALLLGDFTTSDSIAQGINGSLITVERKGQVFAVPEFLLQPVITSGGQGHPFIRVVRYGQQAAQGSLDALGLDFRQLIAQLSVYFTLKMGDMIAVELAAATLELTPGDTLHAAINGDLKLTTRVK